MSVPFPGTGRETGQPRFPQRAAGPRTGTPGGCTPGECKRLPGICQDPGPVAKDPTWSGRTPVTELTWGAGR